MNRSSIKARMLCIILALMMSTALLPLTASAEAEPVYGADLSLTDGFALSGGVLTHGGAEGSMPLGRTSGNAGDVFILTALVRGSGSGSIVEQSGKASLALAPSSDFAECSTQIALSENGVIGLSLVANGDLEIKDLQLKKAISSGELVENGGFEATGGFGSGSEGNAASGSKSLYIPATNMYIASYGVSIEPNSWYLYSADLMRERDGHWLYVDMNDISGELQLRAKSAGVWEHAAGLWYSGDRTSVSLRIVVESNYDHPDSGYLDASDSYIDNISFRKVSVGSNLITDGSFSKGGWTVSGGGSVQSAIYRSAGSCLSSDATGELTATAKDAVTLKANTSYSLSGYMLRADKSILTGAASVGSKTASRLTTSSSSR